MSLGLKPGPPAAPDELARLSLDPLKYRELTEKILGIFYEVYNELGHGLLEQVLWSKH